MDVLDSSEMMLFNTLNAELNPIYYFVALVGAHHIFHVSRVRVKRNLKKKFWNKWTAFFGTEWGLVVDCCKGTD